MNDAYSIAEAKNNLSGLVHKAEQGHPVRLTRRGKPVAVLISTQQYERLSKLRKKIEWSAAVIDTKNLKFDRDEANERSWQRLQNPRWGAVQPTESIRALTGQ